MQNHSTVLDQTTWESISTSRDTSLPHITILLGSHNFKLRECHYAHREGTRILQVAGRMPAFDAGSDIVLCMSQLNLSAHAYHCTLNLSHATTDLTGSEDIQSTHLAKAYNTVQRL